MQITELRLQGFKSFVDPARAPIEQGLTGIVGPNGCGKSNLLEAVRWVMGATSAKSMRASDMDDVIFSGSAGRPAREHAEVTLLLNDAGGRVPAPFHTEDVLEVSRRIRRGLGSTYRINGKEVRAKDVQLLFADAATGANSPALVRQGQISELIAAKPQNRRRILEDAAGIAGLHARRHEADLKLKAAEANLDRLDEIASEIAAQAQSLKKQARQAERYRGLAHTLRETEALLLHRRWSDAREREAGAQAALRHAERAAAQAASEASAAERSADEARAALGPLREEEAVAAAVLRRLEGVRVGLERDLADAEAAVERCNAEAQRAMEEAERLYALKRDADETLGRLSQEAAALGPADTEAGEAALCAAQDAETDAAARRADAEARLEAIAAGAVAQRARAQAMRDAAQAARTRLERLEAQGRELRAQISALPAPDKTLDRIEQARAYAETARAKGAELSAALEEAENALKMAEAAEDAAAARYRLAEKALHELQAEIRAIEQIAPAAAAEYPPVLYSIDVAPGFERALAAALGEDIEASIDGAAPQYWGGAAAPQAILPRSAQPLTRFVQAPAALAARLALIGVVDAKDGPALCKHLAPGVRLVSKEGDLWRWDGFVRRAEAPQPAAIRLEHKNRLAVAGVEIDAAERALADAGAALEAAKAERRQLDADARDMRSKASELAAAETDAARALDRVEAEHERTAQRSEELNTRARALEAEIAEARIAAEAAPDSPAPHVDGASLAEARAEVEAARIAAAEASATVQSLLRDRAQRSARRQAIEHESARWRARIEEADARLSEIAAELQQLERRRDAAKAAPGQARERLAALMEEAGAVEERRASAGDRVAEAEAAARAAAEHARALEHTHAAAREQRAAAQAHAEAAVARVEDIAAHAREQTGTPPEDLAGMAGGLLSGALGSASIAEIERRLERLRAEREAAGPVNLRAQEELAETVQRLTTLTKEKEDVAQGVAKLRRAISALNNEGRARLLRAFEEVDAHFAQLFSTLFEGGQAALKLTESDDPLEAGLEIFAQPPGKRLSHLSLLSGGEQALTATALIFAVFLANPAPLCVLDEVDAPLDDANVDRFCRLLDEMKRLTTTRFVVITHNPVTMSRMDRLYGVTMPEQGVSQLVSVDLGRAQALAAE